MVESDPFEDIIMDLVWWWGDVMIGKGFGIENEEI
jgi:hypothetical protein